MKTRGFLAMATAKKSRIVSLLILGVLLFSLFAPIFSFSSFAEESVNGFHPNETSKKYTTEKVVQTIPKSIEITLKVAPEYDTSYYIMSSYAAKTQRSFGVGIGATGNPYFYVYDDENKSIGASFTDLDIRTGEWIHLAIVFDDENSAVHCYINGELKGTKSDISVPKGLTAKCPTVIGGSYTASRFPGEILNIAAYSDMRSAAEVLEDYTTAPEADGLIYRYDFKGFDKENVPETIADLSGNGNDLSIFTHLYDEPVVELNDYAYSFALVGDIQVVNVKYPDNLHCIYDWIVENKDDKKISFVMNLGDITDQNTEREWQSANEVIHTLDGVVPYSVVRGNHDKNIDLYNAYFNYEYYKENGMVDGSFDETMLNTYQTFEVCGHKYLVLNLDFIASTGSIKWANRIVEQHHDYNVIVTTHIYLANDGDPLVRGEDRLNAAAYKSAYDGEQLWDKFLSKHENIIAIISGHITSQTILTTYRTGVNGNSVAQILVDPQGFDGAYSGGLGLVGMLYFSEDGKIAQMQYYSTIRDQYFNPYSEITAEFNVVDYNENHTYIDYHDSYVHWQECKCGDIKNHGDHVYGEWTIITEATEEKRGQKTATCECGYVRKLYYDYEPPITDDPIETDKEDYTLLIVGISIGGAALLGAVGYFTYAFVKKRKKSVSQTSFNP